MSSEKIYNQGDRTMNKTEIMSMLKILNDEKLNVEGQREKLIHYLREQQHLLNAKEKGSNVKKQYQQAKKFLKDISEARPILKFVDYQDGYQVFTNSYVAFMMKNSIEGLPYHEDENGVYPSLEGFVPDEKNAECITSLFDYTAVLNKCDDMKMNKVKHPGVDYLIKYNNAYLNPLYIKQVVEILCDDISNINVYHSGDHYPVLFTNSKGDKAVICTVRVN